MRSTHIRSIPSCGWEQHVPNHSHTRPRDVLSGRLVVASRRSGQGAADSRKGEGTLYCLADVGATLGDTNSHQACQGVRRTLDRFPDVGGNKLFPHTHGHTRPRDVLSGRLLVASRPEGTLEIVLLLSSKLVEVCVRFIALSARQWEQARRRRTRGWQAKRTWE